MRLKQQPEPTYAVFYNGTAHHGTARELLDGIRREAATRSKKFKKLTTEGYASAIIADAPFSLDNDFLAYLTKEPFPTAYDRALRYLAEMSASGVRILTRQEV